MFFSAWAEIRDWMTAVGTFGAVVVAVGLAWRGARRRKKRRPVLSLAFDPATGIVNETVTYQQMQLMIGQGEPHMVVIGQGPAAHLRFEVTNARGGDAAEDVEVLLARIDKPSFVAETETVEISFPPFGWTHLDAIRLTIPPGVTRSIDVARLHGTPPAGDNLDDVLELLVRPEPGNFRNRLPPATYELHLTLAARNADAVDYVTRIGITDEANPHDPAARLSVIDAPYPADQTLEGWRVSKLAKLWWRASARARAIASGTRAD